jgi:hypothetical protein
MIVKKIFETRLDIKDINFIFCQNYNERIIAELTEKYKNVCFKSVYILEITKIIKKGEMYCKNKVLDGSTYMDITFEALGIVYEKGEILHNCKILQINNNGTMHAKGKYTSIYVKNIDGMNIFKVGEEIPLIVNMCRYNIYETEISVSAIPLIPIAKKSVIYRVINTNATTDIELKINKGFPFGDLAVLLKKLKDIKNDNKAVYKFFNDLIYPYKKDQVKIGKETTTEIHNLMGDYEMVYIPNTRLDDDTFMVLGDKNVEKIMKIDPDTVTIHIDKTDCILMILYDYLKRTQILYDFATVYDNTEKIKSKSDIWSLYDMLKV